MLVSEDKKWDFALGMIKVDGLSPSPEMLGMIEKEKRDEMTMDEIRESLYKMYNIKPLET